ncbi:MAG: family peptidase [Gammaproteobacteria bacterium]|jgi:tRNA threonylcarbamoyladenosine biosynthesis protein TsaB|nr:family peptidase [Gammaproteobacteria bacterium]
MKPTLLALDSSTDSCTVALQVNGKFYSEHVVEARRHNELLLTMIDSVMQQASIQFSELDGIAFGAGPGSFVGVRIAVAIAQGLSFAAKKPVIRLSSLQIMAQTALREQAVKQAQVIVDARMQQAYVGLYQENQALMLPIQPDSIQPIDQISLMPGFAKIDVLPNAMDMLPLAEFYYAKGQTLKPEQALPIYLDEAKQWKKLGA